MRVLMIVRQFFPWVGGTERQAQKLSAKLIELGIDVRVVTGWWMWNTPRQEIIDNIPVFRNFTGWSMLGIKGLRKFGGYLYMLSLFWYLWKQRHTYDVIHIHLLSYPAFTGVLAGRWLGKKTLIKIANSGQGSDIRRMQANDLLPGQRQMLPTALEADRIVAINEESVTELRQVNFPSERIVVIPNGVELNGYHKCDYHLKKPMTLLFVGRFHPNKGLDVLLPAFKQFLESRPDLAARLWLLGDGPLRTELEHLAGQLGIAQVVKFWGRVDDVSAYLAQADIFILPSRTEGISNALLEAMAHGLPCIATEIGGNVDLIRPNENGLLIPTDNPAALTEAIIRLAENQSLREALGTAACRTIEREYSLDSVARRYIGLYEELLRS